MSPKNLGIAALVVAGGVALLLSRGPLGPKRAERVAPTSAPEPGRALEGPLLAPETGYEFAVYHPPRPRVDAVALGKKLASERPALQAGVLTMDSPDLSEYAPPSPEILKLFGRGLSPEQVAALKDSSAATRFRVRTSGANAVVVLREVEAVVTQVAQEAGGVIWDEETRLCWSQEAWAKRLLEGWSGQTPVVLKHITVHAYRNDALVRGITLGMAKFGLPDLVVEGMEARHSTQMALLVDVVGQTLLANPELPPGGALALDLDAAAARPIAPFVDRLPSATGKATVGLAEAAHEEGDPENRLLKIVFSQAQGQGVGEAQSAAIVSLFGAEDSVKYVAHDAELEAAKVSARKRLLEVIKPRFLKRLEATEALSVKAPFTTDSDGVEWMWVEVHRWSGTQVEGRLANEPFEIAELHSGAEVVFEEDVIFDYLLSRSDGTSEGNETGKIIEAREGREVKR